jgi:hypothetical protein
VRKIVAKEKVRDEESEEESGDEVILIEEAPRTPI